VNRALLIAAAFALSAPPVAAQDATPVVQAARPSLDWMVGEWAGEGVLFGRPSKVTMSVKPAIGGNGVALDYAIKIQASDKAPAMDFAAHAFFREGAKGRWAGRWGDNFGNLHDVSGRIDGQAMYTMWGSPDTEMGKSSYVIDAGAMVITDHVVRGRGEFEQFAMSRLTKK
jgi:hypothetical protein